MAWGRRKEQKDIERKILRVRLENERRIVYHIISSIEKKGTKEERKINYTKNKGKQKDGHR